MIFTLEVIIDDNLGYLASYELARILRDTSLTVGGRALEDCNGTCRDKQGNQIGRYYVGGN